MSEGLEIFTDRKVYSIPNGLNELMYDISKEVLRAQPKNIYTFISQYLITLLKVREAVKVAVPIVEKDFITAEYQTTLLEKYNLTKEQADRFAVRIQAAFRGYRTRKRLLHLVDELEGKREKKESISEEEVDYTDPLFQILKTRGISKEQTIEAVTKIQAYFRGYKVRKLEKRKGIECLVRGIPSHESWRHDWLKEPMVTKPNTTEELPWRKSFTEFHKNFIRRHEGDRLHMETIFGGKYEDYNWVCDYASCHELEIPTQLQAKELARPGDIASTSSDEILSISDVEEKKKILLSNAAGEKMIFEHIAAEKRSLSSRSFLLTDDTPKAKEVELIPMLAPLTRERSITMLSSSQPKQVGKSPSVVSSLKSESSKQSQGSRKSKTSSRKGSKGSVVAAHTPELSVRSLSKTGEEGEKISEDLTTETVQGNINEETLSLGRKGSQLGSNEDEASRVSVGSKKSGGSQGNGSQRGSKKSGEIDAITSNQELKESGNIGRDDRSKKSNESADGANE